jgi:hypothetical protein
MKNIKSLIFTSLLTVFFLSKGLAQDVRSQRKWIDLQPRTNVVLSQSFVTSGATPLKFNSGDRFELESIEILDYVNVSLYSLKALICENKTAKSDLDVYDFTFSNTTQSIGIELYENCRLEVYVETNERNFISIFQ